MNYDEVLECVNNASEGRLRAFATCIIDAMLDWPEALRAFRDSDKYFDESHDFFHPKTTEGWFGARLLATALDRLVKPRR